MTQEAIARTAATLSGIWDGGTVERVRAGDGSFKLHNRRMAMHLMGQPVIVEAALSNDTLKGQGFLARCLLSYPASTIGTRPYKAVDLNSDPAVLRYRQTALRLLRKPIPFDLTDRMGGLKPRRLTLTREAMARWVDFHNEVERQLSSDGPYADVAAPGSKTAEQAARIAGVLALFDDPDACQVGADVMSRAITIARWHLGEACRLAGTASISPETRKAEALLAWLHKDGSEFIYSTRALQFGPMCIREKRDFTQAVRVLEEAGWLIPVDGPIKIDGTMRKKAWRVVPVH